MFFDFGDTLASTNPPYILRTAMSLRNAGIDITDREFEYKYLKADYELYLNHLEESGITPGEHMSKFFPILYSSILPAGEIESYRTKVRSHMSGIKFTRRALPGAYEVLDFLKSKGYRLAVISNNDGRTPEKCDEVGMRRYFELILDSTNLGLIKPDPRIFRHALDEMGISAEEAVHVGDMYGADVMGAKNAGMDAVWLNYRNIDRLNDRDINEVGALSDLISLF